MYEARLIKPVVTVLSDGHYDIEWQTLDGQSTDGPPVTVEADVADASICHAKVTLPYSTAYFGNPQVGGETE